MLLCKKKEANLSLLPLVKNIPFQRNYTEVKPTLSRLVVPKEFNVAHVTSTSDVKMQKVSRTAVDQPAFGWFNYNEINTQQFLNFSNKNSTYCFQI